MYICIYVYVYVNKYMNMYIHRNTYVKTIKYFLSFLAEYQRHKNYLVILY